MGHEKCEVMQCNVVVKKKVCERHTSRYVTLTLNSPAVATCEVRLSNDGRHIHFTGILNYSTFHVLICPMYRDTLSSFRQIPTILLSPSPPVEIGIELDKPTELAC